MNQEIDTLVDFIRNREGHCVIASGNIFDLITYRSQKFSTLRSLLEKLTEKRFPKCLVFDIFSGVSVVRGDAKEMSKAMGFEPPSAPKDENEKLVQSIKKAQMKSGDSPFPINPIEFFSGLDRFFRGDDKSNEPMLIILDYADTLMPAQFQGIDRQAEKALGVAVTKWALDSGIKDREHMIVLLCHHAADLKDQVRDRSFQIKQVRLSKPNEQEREDFLTNGKIDKKIIRELVQITAGLSFRELEKIVEYSGKNSPEAILEKVFETKHQVLAEEFGDLMEVMQTKNGFEAIGGLEKPIAKLKLIVKHMKEGKTSLVPQGMLFVGPPGTGKTVLVEAFAKAAGLNFVRPLDIKSMWLGESEKRMTKFLDAIKDLSPVVVFVDEFDQNQAQRGGFDGDSGTSRNLFKKMLEIMSDTTYRGRILWIFASNRPDLIDPAMKRPGRCDLRIPFLPPDAKQLCLIAKAAFHQYPDMKTSITNWEPFVKKCEGYSGADMIEVIRRAWERANEDGRSEIKKEDMEWACDDYLPQQLDKKTVARMSLLALIECSSKDLMPENWKELVPDYLEELTGERPKKFDEDFLRNALDVALQGKPEMN